MAEQGGVGIIAVQCPSLIWRSASVTCCCLRDSISAMALRCSSALNTFEGNGAISGMGGMAGTKDGLHAAHNAATAKIASKRHILSAICCIVLPNAFCAI